MAKRSYMDPYGISGKWLGVYLEIFLKTMCLLGNFGDCGLITKKPRRLFAKFPG
jgi:hypothetical protein